MMIKRIHWKFNLTIHSENRWWHNWIYQIIPSLFNFCCMWFSC